MASTFEARYHGPCANGDHISPGEEVQYGVDRELVHVTCEDAPPEPLRGEVCPQCFLEKPSAGGPCTNCEA